MDGLTPGRMVHYVHGPTRWVHDPSSPLRELEEADPKAGEHEAAIVAGVVDAEAGTCNLFVIEQTGMPHVRPEVPFSDAKEPGTWHWIERA